VPISHARRPVAALSLSLVAAACGSDVRASATGTPAARGRAARLPAEIAALAAPGTPYVETAVAGGGRVRGTVRFDGEPPRDSVVHPTSDQAVCGAQFTDESVAAGRGGAVAGAVVWLTGVRQGKPLPVERRYSLTNARCRLVPRVQAAAVRGTLNVRSEDRLVLHETRFVRQADDLPVLAVTHTNNDGEVVPVEAVLGRPGLVEARCDHHPWTQGWLFAFDHPYFATTATDGSFAMDSVPPGRYTLIAWHERGGVVRREVTVGAGGEGVVELELKGK
jgi:hypothetical protein